MHRPALPRYPDGVRRLVVLVTCAALFAPAGLAATRPAVQVTGTHPLALRGLHFRPAERVTVRVGAGSMVRVHVVRASATGTFTTTFTAVSLERCAPLAVVARGSKGSVATIRPSPFRDCSPL